MVPHEVTSLLPSSFKPFGALLMEHMKLLEFKHVECGAFFYTPPAKPFLPGLQNTLKLFELLCTSEILILVPVPAVR